MANGLQNLREDYLYDKLPDGVINLDEQNILRALIGGVQDRLEDIRSYAKKYEFFFSSNTLVNTVVLLTFDTLYGKTITRSLDVQEDTPLNEGPDLQTWAVAQLGIDASQVTSVVFGEDLLRFVDTDTLQYLAASIGAVLYHTAAQSGDTALNEQKILNSYFPRLKIKGTAQSFDVLGKLIGFDDVRMTPLWSRLSPRQPNDVGAAANDADFAQVPQYFPQQQIGVAYDPHIFRDGPYYSWTGTVSADPSSTLFYTQTVNGFQPWVKVLVTGSNIVHPVDGSVITLEGGAPHTQASAEAGVGLVFQALGEGADFNGLQVQFTTFNDGTDRLVSITDRLSAIKYRSSYFDLALTLTDEHAQAQFGTTTSKPNADLAANPTLDEGRAAASPFRPWRAGSGNSGQTFHDFVYVSSGTVIPVTARVQATTATTQFKTDDIQAAGQEALHVMDEVRAATRSARRSSVGFLNRDAVEYAAQINTTELFEMTGTAAAEGFAHSHPAPGYNLSARIRNTNTLHITWPTQVGFTYYVRFSNTLFGPFVRISKMEPGNGKTGEFFAVIGSSAGFFQVVFFANNDPSQTVLGSPPTNFDTVNVSLPLQTSFEPTSNGTLIRFTDGVFFNGTYDLGQDYYRFESLGNHHFIDASGLIVDASWVTTDTETVRSDPFATPNTQVFAAFGDTAANNNTYQVGTLVAGWQPDFLLMLGDLNGGNYAATNAPFAPWINDGKAIAISGNTDLAFADQVAFNVFFKQNQNYFSRRIGNVEVFAINDGIDGSANATFPGGIGQLSPSAQWLEKNLSASQAPWKVVMIHHDPYISQNDQYGFFDVLRWPFKDWGADLVMFGYVHAFEHLNVMDVQRGNNGVHMLCLGLGGETSFTTFGTTGVSPYSVTRYPVIGQTPKPGAARFTVSPTTLVWDMYATDGTLLEHYSLSKPLPGAIYQPRPEDQTGLEGKFELFDDVPWRRDLIGNGELVEIQNRVPPAVADALTLAVSAAVAVKDHTGAEYTVYGINSTVSPIRLQAQANSTTDYMPGQLPIAYSGNFNDLLNIPPKREDIVPGFFTDAETYGTNGFKLYHAGLVQGVLVADPVSFYSPAHRDGLKLWLPFNEHPDEGAVVLDHSTSGVQQTLSGFNLTGSFADRAFNTSVGWYIQVGSGASIIGDGIAEVQPDMSVSFWFSGSLANTGPAVLYKQGPLNIHVGSGGTNVVIDYTHKDNSVQNVASLSQLSTDFNQIAVVVDDQYVQYGIADRNTSLVLSTGTLSANYQPFNGTHTDFLIESPREHIAFSDLRVWNRAKTQTELDKIRDYKPVPTICTYWPTNITVAGSGDRYGLKKLSNGLVYPTVMPPNVRLNQQMRVIRYNDEGRYEGENRFNEVGLGGGTPLPPVYKLGQQFYELTSTGTTVFSTSLGDTPFNPLWQLAGNNSFVGLPFNGSTASGIPGSGTNYPSPYWPPAGEFWNPAREFVWLKGDTGDVFEVSLVSTAMAVTMVGSLVVRHRTDAELVLNGALQVVTAQPTVQHDGWSTTGTAWVTFNNGTFYPNQVLVETDGTQVVNIDPASHGVSVLTDGTGVVKVYHPQVYRNIEEPTGAVSIIQSGGTEVTVNRGGVVYQRATSGTLSTPPLYMYLTALTKEPTSGLPDNAYAAWTDATDNTLYGNKLVPPQAALNANGILEFENTSDLNPGHYRLTIHSAAIGRVDPDFDGFSTTITVDTVTFDARLLVGKTGADFDGFDVFEFDYSGNITENWLLTIQFLNALTDVNRGTSRNLNIIGYKLEKIETDLYAVTIGAGPGPTLTVIDCGTYTGQNPGGWLAIVNSYGSLVNVVHESLVFPGNDTVVSHVPLSSLLTSDTWQRREDHYASASSLSVLPDSAPVVQPTFGGIIVR